MSVHRRLLLSAGGSGSFTLPASNLFAMFNGQNGDGEYHIGQASWTAGVWTQDAANPVLSKSGAGFISSHVKDPWVMPSGLAAYCSGYNGTYYQIGRATRPDTASTTWTYDSTTTPHIALGSGGDPDEHGASFPTVLDTGSGSKRFQMWYRGQDASDVLSVCYAYSADGLTWTKVGRVLSKGAGGAWDDVGVQPAAIYLSGSTYHLFYGGFSSSSAPFFWQGGVATFTDPEGTYTKAAGNPTLTNSVGVSGINENLTANTASGSAVVTVGNTSHWVVGMPMLIADANSESEYHAIASIDSGTQVTLDSPVASTFATANAAVIRPFDFVSVLGRSVLSASGGGYQLFYAPFQPQDDLSTGGTGLREASMRATASSLTGAWTPVYSEGLLFPLFPATSGWNKFSAENPSVIVAP